MEIYLYNTLSKKKEKFIPIEKDKVKMYTCGPTVYHYAHIGNLRTYIMEDILEKFLIYCGYDVRRVMNITDVGHLSGDSDVGEDKLITGAKRENKTVLEIAQFYENAFFEDCAKLNINKPEITVPATACINDYINIIKVLLDKEYAYLSGDNVYFDTSKVNEYYQLSGQNYNELMIGVRSEVNEDSNKKNASDFVLWFNKSKFENQELKWDSPWGIGYPGWHIECTGISIKYLGEYIDIHCGGIDNIFPHHTNEIVQSEAYLGHKWCNYWFHIHHLEDKEGKMSKSRGDFLTLSLLEEKNYNPMAYRLYCLQSHYRKPLGFDFVSLDNVTLTYNKLKKKILELDSKGVVDYTFVDNYRSKFIEVMGNDLNTASVLTLLYHLLKESVNDVTKLILIKEFDTVLSLDLTKNTNITVTKEYEKYIKNKIDERNNARKQNNYELADKIRDELLSEGIEIKDTKNGTIWNMVRDI